QQGLIVERATDIYSFSHLTLQEYLAARHFFENGKIAWLVENHLFDPRWREVFLLLAGLGRADELLLRMSNEISKLNSTGQKAFRLLEWAKKHVVGLETEAEC